MTTFPTINNNGSDPKQMLGDYREAIQLANKLIKKLAEMKPHGRDYQTMPAGSFEAAREEHDAQIDKVVSVMTHLTAIGVEIIKQKGLDGNKMRSVGSKLRNGATVLAYKEVGEMPFNRGPLAEGIPTARAIVMAFTSEEAATPFVTWAMNVDDGSTYWGHYYKTAKEAWDDFQERW